MSTHINTAEFQCWACILYVKQTYLLAMYRASQPSHEESQLHLSAAQYDLLTFTLQSIHIIQSMQGLLPYFSLLTWCWYILRHGPTNPEWILSKINVFIQGRNYYRTWRPLPFSSIRTPNAQEHTFTQGVKWVTVDGMLRLWAAFLLILNNLKEIDVLLYKKKCWVVTNLPSAEA